MKEGTMEDKNLALLEAVMADNKEAIVEAITGGANPNFMNGPEHVPLLLIAVLHGQLDVTRLLLKMGATTPSDDDTKKNQPVKASVIDDQSVTDEKIVVSATLLLMAGAMLYKRVTVDELIAMVNSEKNVIVPLATLLGIPLNFINGVCYPTEKTYTDLKHALLLEDDHAVREYSLDVLVRIIKVSVLPDPGEFLSEGAKRRMETSTADLLKAARKAELAKRRNAKVKDSKKDRKKLRKKK